MLYIINKNKWLYILVPKLLEKKPTNKSVSIRNWFAFSDVRYDRILSIFSSLLVNKCWNFAKVFTTNYNKQNKKKVTWHKSSLMGRDSKRATLWGDNFCIQWRRAAGCVGGGLWERGQEWFSWIVSLSFLDNFTNARKIPGRSILNRDSLSRNRNSWATRPVPVKKCHGWR